MAKVVKLAQRKKRFKKESYFFVFAAMEYTVSRLSKRRHITARELLDGIAEYARQQYGPLAKMVFEHWGITETIHFGQIVYNLIEAGLMSKTKEDKLEDFDGVYDFSSKFDWNLTARTLEFPDRFR